jgi:hypothetical protein
MPAANSATHPATKSGNGSVILDIPIAPTWWGQRFLTQEHTSARVTKANLELVNTLSVRVAASR